LTKPPCAAAEPGAEQLTEPTPTAQQHELHAAVVAEEAVAPQTAAELAAEQAPTVALEIAFVEQEEAMPEPQRDMDGVHEDADIAQGPFGDSLPESAPESTNVYPLAATWASMLELLTQPLPAPPLWLVVLAVALVAWQVRDTCLCPTQLILGDASQIALSAPGFAARKEVEGVS
jgi:hypothetical protein